METATQQKVPDTSQIFTNSQTVPLLPKPSKINILVAFGISVFLIISTISGYLYLKKAPETTIDKSNSTPPYLTDTLKTTITPSPNPTIKWHTYSNSVYHYEIKYPPGWVLREPSVLEYYGNSQISIPTHSIHITAYNKTQRSLEEHAISLGTRCVGTCPESGDGLNLIEGKDYQLIKPKVEKKSNHNLSEYYFITSHNGTIEAIIPIPDNNKYYIYIWPSAWPKNESKDLFDQILSTFKFSEETK